MGQAVIYVDGWNLYHGIKSRYGRTYLWLDLYGLAARMRQPDSILKVRYFTTIVAGEPDAARNQETYLAALTSYRPAVAVVRGRFKRVSSAAPNVASVGPADARRPRSSPPMRRSSPMWRWASRW